MVITKTQKIWLESDFVLELLKQIPASVFWKDKDSVYLGCNDAFAHSLGLSSPEEVIGKTDYDLPTTKEESDAFRADDQQVIKSKKPKLNIEEYQTLPDGKRVALLTNKVPLLDKQNNVMGILGIYYDITERKKQEQELKLALEQAALAAKAKNDFLAIMSHELRNAVGNIVSALQLAAIQDRVAKDAKNYLAVAEKTAKDILPFLENVSNYFELESGLIYANKNPTNVVETIRAVIKNYLTAKKAEVNVLIDMSYDLPEKILVDNYNLYKVLNIVIYNAIRFTQQGSITIKAHTTTDGYLSITVSDTGIGMSEAQVNNLFNAFPISPEQNAKYRKFGLRLSIAKKMLQLIGGDITIQSQEGKGTQATIKLPFAAINEMDMTDTKAKPITLNPLTILVVEDDPVSLEIEITLLNQLGHTVDAVATGMDAVNQANQKSYDLILMDITLPDISGVEAAKLIHKNQPDLPIVAVTSHSSEEAVDDLLSHGILSVISKPISLATFEEFFANFARLLKEDDE